MIQTATNTCYNKEQEEDAKAQERERRKETRHAQMLAALQGSPIAHPESLKDKVWGKCLIYRQEGDCAKGCLNRDKSPTNAINWEIGRHSALGTQEPQGQAPRLLSRWFNRTEAASSSQPTCHREVSRGWSQECKWMWQVGQNFLVDTGATSSVLISYSRAFSSQTCTFGFYRKSNYKKIHPSTSLLLGWTDIFPPVSGGP